MQTKFKTDEKDSVLYHVLGELEKAISFATSKNDSLWEKGEGTVSFNMIRSGTAGYLAGLKDAYDIVYKEHRKLQIVGSIL